MTEDTTKLEFVCQRCQHPLRLEATLASIDEHTLAELSLPINAPPPDIDLAAQVQAN